VLRATLLAAVASILAGGFLVPADADPANPNDGTNSGVVTPPCAVGACLYGAYSFGATEGNLGGKASTTLTGPETPDPCPWMPVDDLGAGSSWWEGHDPSTGHIELNKCAGGNLSVPGGTIIFTQFVPNGAPAPPPDPRVLAQQAIGQLTVPKPTVGVGPDRSKMAVSLWTWLWVDSPPPVSVTVAAGGVSVTATATLTSTTWSLGEPAATDGPYEPGPPVTVTCTGGGTPTPANYDWKAEPPCGHMFAWRSLRERTGGTGTWPITATTNWTVTWASNTGLTGADTLSATTADQFDVQEYRIVLVNTPGG
jgi:hypothetical protein